MPPPIPPITDPDLREACSALTRAADTYRQALFLLADRVIESGGGKSADFDHVIAQAEDVLNLSDSVINAWKEHLGD